MLKEYIQNGFGIKEDLSCSETILHGANDVWNLGLSKETLKMSAGLSAGCYTENICGTLSAASLVLSRLYVKNRAHNSPRNAELIEEMINLYKKQMGSEMCKDLKETHRTEEEKCRPVIIRAAEILDQIIQREGIPSGT